MIQPQLVTPRLLLRPLVALDAPRLRLLAGDQRVAERTLRIPHPYPDGLADRWIADCAQWWAMGRAAVFAVTTIARDELIGCVGLERREGSYAELGYWIGVPYWNRGYATEAAQAVCDFGFGDFGLTRVRGKHRLDNQNSGRVMEKLGFTFLHTEKTASGKAPMRVMEKSVGAMCCAA